MTVKDYMTYGGAVPVLSSRPHITSGSHILEALKLWHTTADGCMDVSDADGSIAGHLTSDSMVHALGDLLSAPQENVLIELECDTDAYSASRIAMAVEDADTPLLGLWRHGTQRPGKAAAVIMAGAGNPSAICRSLRRYGYDAAPAGHGCDDDLKEAMDNIAALKMYLEI